MTVTPLQLARQACRAAVLGVCAWGLTGCQSLGTASSLAHVRVIDLSPEASAIDIYRDGSALAYNLSYGAVTSYIPAAPGVSSLTVDLAGSTQVLSTAKGTFAAGAYYTVLVNNPAASLQPTVLADHAPMQGAGGPYVRLVHQALQAGAVDVYLVPAGQRLRAASLVASNLAPGATTGYLAVPAGLCTAVMLPAGTVPAIGTVPAHTGTQLSYEAGVLRSLILIDAPPAQPVGLQVIATIDMEAPN